MSDKIRDEQLQRAAYVYIRQSTLQQVRHNIESNRRQYALEERARELGFRNVVMIDEDLGISGTGSRERPGFGRLLTAVCNGEVGGVFALEASRLARNNRDWHHLIDLCVLTKTVVVDADGVYDPRVLNDRLLLGLKGTMSEFEIGILRQRAQEAYRQKVLRGEVLTRVPIGYVRCEPNGIAITPDREVQQAIRSVFENFDRMGSLRQVLLWHHQEKICLPVLQVRDGIETLFWRLPEYQQLLRILKNPTYAGAFAYGRTQAKSQVYDGRSRKSSGHKVAMEKWQVLIRDHHAGYISWDRYVENQRILTSNRTKAHAVSSGAAKKGRALLTGLFRCARCGHKLHVAYRGRDGNGARYWCMTGNKDQGNPSCLSFGALRVEQAVVDVVLEACEPMGVEASIQAFHASAAENDQTKRALELAIERLRYEADRARRQYDAVDPGNRLVAAELEARWNTALAKVTEAEGHLQSKLGEAPELTKSQREQLTRLGKDLQAAWNEPAAPVELKKRILRTVISEIVVNVNHQADSIEMQIHWAGGVHTPVTLRKNRTGRTGRATSMDVVELVRELAKAQTDPQIAGTLNRLGHSTGPGNSWNENRVRNLRQNYRIPVFSKGCARSWVTMTEAAAELQVSLGAIRTMIKRGLLTARHVAANAPWMIQRKDLTRTEVRKYVDAIRSGKRMPSSDGDQTLMPIL
jgi:DNA invertase Pin-like site-specific DNA recombinase